MIWQTPNVDYKKTNSTRIGIISYESYCCWRWYYWRLYGRMATPDGHKVTLIDRACPGNVNQASYGNCGIIGRSSVVPVSTPGLIWRAPGLLFDPDTLFRLQWKYVPMLLPWLSRFLWNGRREKVLEIASALATLVKDSDQQHRSLSQGTPAGIFLYSGSYVTVYPDRRGFESNVFENNLRREYGWDCEEWDRSQIEEYDTRTFGPLHVCNRSKRLSFPHISWRICRCVGRAFCAGRWISSDPRSEANFSK